jgi:hypothetical protein
MSLATEFAPLVAILTSLAPPDWTAMRVVYRWDQPRRMSDTALYAVTSKSNPQWVEVGHTTFDMMDFFDAYRDRVLPTLKKPWTSVTVTIKRGEAEPKVAHGYEVLNLTDRTRGPPPSDPP